MKESVIIANGLQNDAAAFTTVEMENFSNTFSALSLLAWQYLWLIRRILHAEIFYSSIGLNMFH